MDAFVTRCNAARAIISAECGLGPARSIAHQGLGERELVERLKESQHPEADLEHVLAVATAEARARRELRWLSWSLATEKSWRAKLSSTVQEAERLPGPKQSTGSTLAKEVLAELQAEEAAAKLRGDS